MEQEFRGVIEFKIAIDDDEMEFVIEVEMAMSGEIEATWEIADD